MTPPHAERPAPAAPAAAGATLGAAAERPPCLRSEQILQGRRTIEIEHNGVLYRLQATRTGKLLLTK